MLSKDHDPIAEQVSESIRQTVLGYPVDLLNEKQALAKIEESWRLRKGMHVVTLNAEMVIQAQKDAELDQVVRHARLIVPDGAGPVWALRLKGHRAARVPGIELAQNALSAAAAADVPVALLGGRPETMDSLLSLLPELYPGLRIVYSHHGYFSTDEEKAIVEEAASCEPGLMLVALGVPKQEYFINRWLPYLPRAVVAGVGGSFDVWTGNVKRAPAIFRKLSLEWLYRLLSEPWRFKRICSALPSFAIQVIFESLSLGPSKTNSRLPSGNKSQSGAHAGHAGCSHRDCSSRSAPRSKNHEIETEKSKDSNKGGSEP